MVSKALIIAAVIAYVEARFGEENKPIGRISEVQGGEPGAAATIAGAAISTLLGGANSCDKLATADQIVAELGGGADAIEAALGMVTAEYVSFSIFLPCPVAHPYFRMSIQVMIGFYPVGLI
jgi:hypothetical protein